MKSEKGKTLMCYKAKSLLAAGGVGLAMLLSQSTQATQLNFASLVGSLISFDGSSHFTFTPPGVDQFRITASDGVSDSVGDFGQFSGTWTIGPITVNGAQQSALVSGTGTLIVHGGGFDLTGSASWDIIETLGTGGILNVNGVLNLTGLTYGGSQQDLIDLATNQGGNAQANVQFSTTRPNGSQATLTDMATSPFSSSFSGKLVSIPHQVPDGGLTMALLGFALLSIETLRRKLARG